MPDRRRHRGPAPQDREIFAPSALPALGQAVDHLSWLLSRGYALESSLKLVGDRFALVARQRTAVRRCAGSDAACLARRAAAVGAAGLRGKTLWIDGYNVLTTVEAALAGGIVLVGRDGACRDLASMHGSFHHVEETEPALRAILAEIGCLGLERAVFLLDQPVSGSGRLRGLVETMAAESGVTMPASVVADPDRVLVAASGVVATSDSAVLDRCQAQFGLAGWVVRRRVPQAWLVELASAPPDVSAGARS